MSGKWWGRGPTPSEGRPNPPRILPLDKDLRWRVESRPCFVGLGQPDAPVTRHEPAFLSCRQAEERGTRNLDRCSVSVSP